MHEFGEKDNLVDFYRKGVIFDQFCLVLPHEKDQLVTWSLRTSSEFA